MLLWQLIIKKLLNKYTVNIIKRLHDVPRLPKNYTFDNLPKSHQIIVIQNLKRNLLSNILDILEEWSLGVLESANMYNLIYSETHEVLIPFLNRFKSEFRYATIDMDEYKAINYLYRKFQRSDKYGEKN